MSAFTFSLSDDRASLAVSAPSTNELAHLSAGEVDALMRQLAEPRAQMAPVHSEVPSSDRAGTYTGDNLLWCVLPAEDRPALEIGVQHPSIGWIVLSLARDQVEDLQTNIEFALNYLVDRRTTGADSPN